MNKYPINKAQDSLSILIGLLGSKIFSLRGMSLKLSFCGEPKGEVAESIIKNKPRPPGEGRRSQTVDEDRRRFLFCHPSSALTRTPYSQGEGFPSLIETADSATQGKPFVQNDMRVR